MKLVVFLASLYAGMIVNPCEEISAEAKIQNTKNNLENGKATIVVKENSGRQFIYFFYDEKGKPLSTNYKSNTITRLKKGKIFCSVIARDGCQKKLEININ